MSPSIFCPACRMEMRMHAGGACPEVDLSGALEPMAGYPGEPVELEEDEFPGVFIELLTLRHLEEETGNDDDIIDRIVELADVDMAYLLKVSLGVVYGFVCSTAEAAGRPASVILQEMALELAMGAEL